MSARAGHFVNRGFLFGPFCPIYGFGALFLIFILGDFKVKGVSYFFYAMAITTTLELIIGIALRLVFNDNWWDYSEEPFNFAGLICLKSSIMWGFLSMFFMKYIHPVIHRLVSNIPTSLRKSISYLFVLYFLIDCASTVTSITGFHIQLSQLLWIAK